MSSCPLPKFDFEKINLGHGSGGKLTSRLLDSGVFSVFQNPYLQKRDDAAQCPISGDIIVSTDSYVVTPIFFSGGDIGKLAVHGTVNDVAMCGGIPKYLTLSFIIEENFSIEDFRKVLLSISEACAESNVQIITGDTKVVEKNKGDQIFINTTGIGEKHEKAELGAELIKSGDKILVSGSVGLHGATIMGHREGFNFTGNIQSDTKPLNLLVEKMLSEFGSAIRFMRDPTRGGISSSLNETAELSKKGVYLFQEKIPVPQEVEDLSSVLGLDPFYMANEGIFIACVAEDKADEVLVFLKKHEYGKDASIIGHFIEEHVGKVILENLIGGRRPLNLLPGEQLPRIC